MRAPLPHDRGLPAPGGGAGTIGAAPDPPAQFDVPPDRVATIPPEHRGIPRDQVRLLTARPERFDHVAFANLGRFLSPGDAVMVNISATRPAAIDGLHADGRVVLHLAARHDDGSWTVELRRPDGTGPVLDAGPGDVVAVEGGGRLTLDSPVAAGPPVRGVRLWRAWLSLPARPDVHLRLHGRPITYGAPADRTALLLSDYQTVFATTPGSAEMVSAGRPFSHRLVTSLVSSGVTVLPVTLHAGVSSQVAGEPPQPEWFEVPTATAAAVNRIRRHGGRVVAVGTTVTRALESATGTGGVRATRGWTDLVVSPDRGVRTVDGLVTGWHEADASHLLVLEAVAGRDLVRRAYAEALAGRYLWHEFGDSCLFLP